MEFAHNLKNARIAAGLTQQQVAEQLGITKSTYCGYETEKRQPDVQKIKMLAEILKVSADTLLGTDGFCTDESDTPKSYTAQTAQERLILSIYRELNEQGRQYILQQFDMARRVYTGECADLPAVEDAG